MSKYVLISLPLTQLQGPCNFTNEIRQVMTEANKTINYNNCINEH